MNAREWLQQLRQEEYEFWSTVLKYARKSVKRNKAKKLYEIWKRKIQ